MMSETVHVDVVVASGHEPSRFYLLPCTARRILEPQFHIIREWLSGKEGSTLVSTLPDGWEPSTHIELCVGEFLERIVNIARVPVYARSLTTEPVADLYLDLEGECLDVVSSAEQFIGDPFVCFFMPGHSWTCPGRVGETGPHVCLDDIPLSMAELGISGASTIVKESQSFIRDYTQGYDPRTQCMLSIFSAALVLQWIGIWVRDMSLVEWSEAFLVEIKYRLCKRLGSARKCTRARVY